MIDILATLLRDALLYRSAEEASLYNADILSTIEYWAYAMDEEGIAQLYDILVQTQKDLLAFIQARLLLDHLLTAFHQKLSH